MSLQQQQPPPPASLKGSVYFDKESGEWRFEETETGEEYNFSNGETWVKLPGDAMIKQQQQAYSRNDIDESTPAAPVLAAQQKKQAKAAKNAVDYTSNTGNTASSGPMSSAKTEQTHKTKERTSNNTAVYVTNLPLDSSVITIASIAHEFKKFGIILPSTDGVTPSVKLYNDENGVFKGEALVVYADKASVQLAINMLDGQRIDWGTDTYGDNSDTVSSVIGVKEAEFTKNHSNAKRPREQNNANETHKSSNDPREQRSNYEDEAKAKKKRAKALENKKAVWTVEDDYDGFGPADDDPTLKANRMESSSKVNSRVVVLKGMFTLMELADDPSLLLEIKDDIREECAAEFGAVTSVTLYDQESSGVVTVKFAEFDAAEACVARNNGRFFSGRRIVSYLYDGRERFNRSTDSENTNESDEKSEKERIEEFGRWLTMH